MTLKEMKKQVQSKNILDGKELQKVLLKIIDKLEEIEKRIP